MYKVWWWEPHFLQISQQWQGQASNTGVKPLLGTHIPYWSTWVHVPPSFKSTFLLICKPWEAAGDGSDPDVVPGSWLQSGQPQMWRHLGNEPLEGNIFFLLNKYWGFFRSNQWCRKFEILTKCEPLIFGSMWRKDYLIINPPLEIKYFFLKSVRGPGYKLLKECLNLRFLNNRGWLAITKCNGCKALTTTIFYVGSYVVARWSPKLLGPDSTGW